VKNGREALSLLDFNDDSIGSLLELLMRALISPLYMKVVEGERFLSWLLTLDGGILVPSLFESIKPQLASGARFKVAAKYGSIIFRGWRDADEVTGRTSIESELQGLAYSAMVCQSHV
jgi:hypothetical protein